MIDLAIDVVLQDLAITPQRDGFANRCCPFAARELSGELVILEVLAILVLDYADDSANDTARP